MSNTMINTKELKEILENQSSLLLDLRPAEAFLNGFIPGSISAGVSTKYDKWILEAIGGEPVVLITEAGKEKTGIDRFEKLVAADLLYVLEGGYDAWVQAAQQSDLVIEVEADELALDLPYDSSLQLIDLRGEEEFEASHVSKAQHIPLAELVDLATIANFDEDQQLYLYCGGGQRSLLAASLIKRQGVHNLRVVAGGFPAIELEKSITLTQKQDHSG
ncbi:rhodanese-like domain-containing protein [Flavihumibacter sp. CACIAM 22H1]|uniref:rhodanese-like domain-containing protein n=1 Tax=Flavihumibacter sp. CACIAM 22H1 TaxID=1812911 RepID=UPI0007A7D907|nr:rhodanese-like domain-containing protein [Flavihumibacter sp. CACIAM 22H1]KYP15685.1 MAG: hypothetical protein A1D16_19170 [Flavihumibacter sp. CACIAM 22H1]